MILMNKKGFTLVELLGVIVLLGLVAVIIFPKITEIIQNQKQKLHDKQISNIEKVSYSWLTDNISTVRTDGYIKDKDIIDPLTNEDLTGCVIIRWDNNANGYQYNYDSTCSTTSVPLSCFDYEKTSTGITITNYKCGDKTTYNSETCNYFQDSSGAYSSVTIPSTIDGVNVTVIGNGAFSNFPNGTFDTSKSSAVRGVTIPSTITNIDSYAFYFDYTLSSVTLPEGVVGIGYNSFYDCNLSSLTIPSSVSYIDGFAFQRNKLTSIVIPNTLTSIGRYAFSQNSLTSVTIGTRLSTLPEGLFWQNSLASITIPSNVTSIGKYAFESNKLTTIAIPNTLKSIDNYAFAKNLLTSATIGTGLSSLPEGLFWYNSLASITIPSNIKSIGSSVFKTNNLTSIDIPNTVTSIGNYAFAEN